MISLKDFLNEGIPNYFRGYFDNVNSNLEEFKVKMKQFEKKYRD